MIEYRARQWASTVLAIALATGAVTACGASHGDPDPGGAALSVLRTVERAIPSDAQVTLRQEYEPRWDSCGGRAGTFGWSDVIVIVDFTTGVQADTLVADVERALRADGWQQPSRSNTPLGPSVRWTRTVTGSTVATASLAPFTRSEGDPITWELTALAPPRGPRVSGC